jgi:hypothetical protein
MASMAIECAILGGKFDWIYVQFTTPEVSTDGSSKYYECQTDNKQFLPDVFVTNRMIKFFLFNFFILSCTFELTAIISMLKYQRKLQLQELDVYKPAFHRKERKLKFWAEHVALYYIGIYMLMIFVYLVFRILWLGDHVTKTSECGVVRIYSSVMVVYVAVFQAALFLFFVVFHFILPVLRNEHHYEFRQHLTQFLLLSVSFLIALAGEALMMYLLYYYVIYNFNTPGANNHHLNKLDDFSAFWLYMILLNTIELLPFFAFLIKSTLYPPHDCFTCFNKDPERRYSIYQYSQDEWR